MLVSELCQVYSGYTTRGRLEPVSTGGLPAIMLRDLTPNGKVSCGTLRRYRLANLPQRCLAHGGDVIFRSRGAPNTAHVVSANMAESAAVILPLIVMRPNCTKILPEYLAWAINQPEAQRRFDAEARGTNLRMIPKAVLERADILVPNLETQRRVVTTYTLSRREGDLLRELADRKEQHADLILRKEVARASRQSPPQ